MRVVVRRSLGRFPRVSGDDPTICLDYDDFN